MASITSRYLLDTCVLVHLIRRDETGLAIGNHFDLWNAEATELNVSVVTVGELRSLAEQWDWGAMNRKSMERTLKRVYVIDIHHEEALRIYGNIDAHSIKIGKKMVSENDVWIAACANVQGLTLLSIDGDFTHLNPNYVTFVHIDPTTGRPRTT
jgi:predicted nucleic acid-binding protein